MDNKSILALGMLPALAIPQAGAYGADRKHAENGEKPNILIIYCDQLAAWTLGCYGGNEIGTPNIDRLAEEGVVMTNFYANTPVSTPSRGCFMSGLYPTEHGAFKNAMQIRQDIPTFASELRDAGYVTGYAGKWHLDGSPKRPGWDLKGKDMGWTDRSAMYSFGHYKTITDTGGEHPVFSSAVSPDPEHYPTDWFTDRAVEFIGKHKNEPFCYMLSIPDPHPAYLVRSPYDSMFPEDDMKIPHTLMDEPENDNYLYHESRLKTNKKSGKTEYQMILENIRQDKSRYFGMIKCIDDNIGRLLDFLRREDLYDNTIIVFSADHGDMMGEHARMAKAVPFESAARVPFIVRYPELLESGVSDNVASAIDFYPTVLSLAGVEQKGVVSGRDLTEELMGKKKDEVAILRCYASSYPWICAVDGRYKLVYGEKDKPGEALLLDRYRDPEESLNFFHDPEYGPVVKRLSKELKEYCMKHGDPHWEWLKSKL